MTKITIPAILLVFGFLLAGCNKSQYPSKQVQPENLTPRDVLHLVKQRYHGHHRLEVKAKGNIHMNINVMGMTRNRTMHTTLYLALGRAGKLRFKGTNPAGWSLIVSNGDKVWQYISMMGEYTENKYTPLQTGVNHLEKIFKHVKTKNTTAGDLARAFNPFTDSIKSVTGLGQDTLIMPDSSKRKVLKIKVDYVQGKMNLNKKLRKLMKNPSVSIENVNITPTTYWIDVTVPVVLRQSFGMSMTVVPKAASSAKRAVKLDMQYDLFYPAVNLNPTFPDTTFTFEPPKGAGKVKKFDFAKKIEEAQHK